MMPSGADNTFPTGINNVDIAALNADKNADQGYTQYTFKRGQFHPLIIPANFPYVTAINDGGAVVGTWLQQGHDTGFVYQSGAFQSLKHPGSLVTHPLGINNSGSVVGYYFDNRTTGHGFLWTPGANKTK